MKPKNSPASPPKKSLAFVLLAALGVGVAANTAADAPRPPQNAVKNAGTVAAASPAYRNAVSPHRKHGRQRTSPTPRQKARLAGA